MRYCEKYPKGSGGAGRRPTAATGRPALSHDRLGTVAEEDNEDLLNNIEEPLAARFTLGVQEFLRAEMIGRQLRVKGGKPQSKDKCALTPTMHFLTNFVMCIVCVVLFTAVIRIVNMIDT